MNALKKDLPLFSFYNLIYYFVPFSHKKDAYSWFHMKQYNLGIFYGKLITFLRQLIFRNRCLRRNMAAAELLRLFT